MSPPPLSHPSHDHPLMLLHVTEASNQVHCGLCDERITGPAYSCNACAAYLHRECAEAPIRILRHPFHPQHPLHQFDSHLQYCSICKSVQYGGYMYRCQECRFFLGFICATATLPPDHDQETREVEYAAHEHPLTPLLARHPLPVCCVLCRVEVEGEAYFCSDCRFFLHKKCFDLPLEIQHPLHAQHPLFPIVRYVGTNDHAPSSRGDNCDACNASCLSANRNYFEKSRPGTYLAFGCLKCEFYLDITCAVNIVPPTNQELKVIAHQHELAPFCVEEKNSIPIDCGICKLKIVGESSCCTTCRFFFHANCVKGPASLEYPVHSEHPLTLTLHTKEGRCQSCDCSLHPLIYGCECGFNVHADCALQALNYHEQGHNAEIWMPWHEHRLVLCHRRAQDKDVCNACGDIVEGLGYICSNILCGLLLHKLCTRLTSQIHHPHHPLILVPEALENKHPCDACLQDIRCFSFSCSKCSFTLDTKCASRLPEQKHQLHHHKLAYFQKVPSLTCYVCCEKSDSAIFRCVYCDFNLHEVCMKLPSTVMSDKHLHELKLWDSYIDDDSGEYYCDFCEQRRHGNVCVYGCEECQLERKLVAHIECALSWMKQRKGCSGYVREKMRLTQKINDLEKQLCAAEAQVQAKKEELKAVKKELVDLDALGEEY